MLIARIPAEFRGIDPALESQGNFRRLRAIYGDFFGMRQILRTARVRDSVVAIREAQRFAVEAIDLRLKWKIRCKAFRRVRINAIITVLNYERSDGWLAVRVVNAKRNRVGGLGIEQNQDLAAKPDILAGLSHIELQQGRA